ncbi:tyrosine-type recombinase/integrase [Aquimarina rhabdastrellae]
MLLDHYIVGFKRYALYEKEINTRTVKDIISITHKLFDFADTDSLKKLDTALIREFLYTQKEKRLWSARTFRNNRQYLKTFFEYCRTHGFIDENPISKINKPKIPKALPRFLTKEQVHSILFHTEFFEWRYHIEKTRNIAIIATFVFTGMRLNELIHLRMEDVNLETKEIIIHFGKGRKERIVPIYPKLMPILQKYLTAKKSIKQQSPWFFQSLRKPSKISSKTIQGFCNKISKASGIKFSPHPLRHTFARNAINAGVGLYMVKEMLGHSSVSTTEIYLSVSKKNLKEVFCGANLL